MPLRLKVSQNCHLATSRECPRKVRPTKSLPGKPRASQLLASIVRPNNPELHSVPNQSGSRPKRVGRNENASATQSVPIDTCPTASHCVHLSKGRQLRSSKMLSNDRPKSSAQVGVPNEPQDLAGVPKPTRRVHRSPPARPARETDRERDRERERERVDASETASEVFSECATL